jgi:hypothetical protein
MRYLAEIGKQIPETPSRIAEGDPVIIIANAASVLQHGVEDGATTENSSLRQRASSTIEIRLRHSHEVPI